MKAAFNEPDTPETIPHVLDAMFFVAVLSQATGWFNAKCAMASMRKVYNSVFADSAIEKGGVLKLQDTIKCGGLYVRNSEILMLLLHEVKERHGKWHRDFLFEMSDEDAMKELIRYKYIGPKSAFVVIRWCLQRNPFTVDTHVYRIAGLWGWRPEKATRELTQAAFGCKGAGRGEEGVTSLVDSSWEGMSWL
ncbi:Hypothetical protein D9617_21g096880 [Elsinoe fawcettii]|nr:Hypothetical protein D9617_21g096880 [Elsinoe fawcettii]